MRAFIQSIRSCFLLAACSLAFGGESLAADSGDQSPPPLYPFVRDGQWGYIDDRGAWIIEPRFERCHEVFIEDRVSVRQDGLWGVIDRTGRWIVEPMFTRILRIADSPFLVVQIDEKQGIMNRDGTMVLSVEYDAITLTGDHAWVRSGDKLGSISLNGTWIHEPSIDWPLERDLPSPTDDGSIAWFKSKNRWGLIARDGRIVCEPRFKEYVMGRHDAEEWIRPAGIDFENHRAWVTEGDDFVLISNEGVELARHPFTDIRKWSDAWFVFTRENGVQGLISRDGEILSGLDFHLIRPLTEGRATIGKRIETRRPDGTVDHVWKYGYIDASGRVVVPIGAFHGPGASPGIGQTGLDPFSGGLAPVWRNNPEMAEKQIYDPCAGYINRDGAVVIPLTFHQSRPFSGGLGAVRERIPREGMSHTGGLWGYVDETGELAIPHQFGSTTPFIRDRAWVLEAGARWDEARWAMIDRTGRVLTDFAYKPPDHTTSWQYEPDGSIAKARWRGELAVISTGQFLNGLATADGTVVVEPAYNHIREFHDGVAVAADSRPRDERGNVKILNLLLTAQGEVLANGVYTRISDFDGGTAWAARQPSSDEQHRQRMLWTLIDHAARELCEAKYIRPWWVWTPDTSAVNHTCPVFVGELAAIASHGGFQQKGPSTFPVADGWGYINRSGEIVAWVDDTPFK